jgi:general secretion pathway protein H
MIEVAVVMLLIAIVLGLVNLQLGEDETSQLRYEAKRLAMLLQTAQEEAILQGQTITLTIEPKGKRESYYFIDANSERIKTDGLQTVALPPGMTFFSVIIDGVPVVIDGVQAAKDPPRLPVPATGEVAPFTFILNLGKDRWRLEGEFGGEIKSSAPESEEGDRDV